jgi:hypothetical protein
VNLTEALTQCWMLELFAEHLSLATWSA